MPGSTAADKKPWGSCPMCSVHQFLSQWPMTSDLVRFGDGGALCFAKSTTKSVSCEHWVLMSITRMRSALSSIIAGLVLWSIQDITSSKGLAEDNAVLLLRSVIKLCEDHKSFSCVPMLLHNFFCLTVWLGREREYTFCCFELLLTSDWSLFLLPSSSSSPSIVFLFPSWSSHASLLPFKIYLTCS